MAVLNSLFVPVDFVNPVRVINLSVNFVFSPLSCVHSPKVRRTPHLICIELVWASVFVSILSRVHALIELVSCLETEFSIPSIRD